MNLGKWIGSVALIAALYVLWQIRQLLLLIFAAVVLATALNMLARRLQRTGIRRSFAVMLSITCLFILLAGFFALIVPPFTAQFQELTELLPRGLDRLDRWLDDLKRLESIDLNEYLPDADTLFKQVQPLFQDLVDRSVTFFTSFLGVALNGLLVVVLTLMMLADPKPYRNTFVRLFPSFYRRRIENVLDRCEASLRGWLAGVLFNMVTIAVFSWMGLSILQVNLALAHGVLAGFMTFIPNIGPALSVIPPMMVAMLDGPWKSLTVLILYIIIQQLESNLLTPYVMAQQISLLPAVTLLAQVFFATSFGFIGLLLALPLTVVAQVWLQEVVIKDILDRWHSDFEDRRLRTEEGGLRTEEGGLKMEEGGLRTEEGGLRTEDGGLRTEEGGLRTEDGGLRTEDGDPNPMSHEP